MPNEPRAAAQTAATLPDHEQARIAHAVMRRQARLSVRLALLFLTLILGLPLVNLYLPDVANAPVAGGFTASWLFLGVLFFPITWALSAWFIRASDAIEADSRHWREVLGQEAGQPIEPAGAGDVKPAFIEETEGVRRP